MKICPNPSCIFTGIPDEAKFCPNCGTALQKEEPVKKMTISECRLAPNVIKKGEKCELRWRGTNVKSIVIDGAGYSTRQDIFLAPTQSREYDIQFIGEDGMKIIDKVGITVKSQYIFGEDGKLMKDGFFKIDLRQVQEKGTRAYSLPYMRYQWGVITGEHPVKAYVADDEMFEVVFDKNGRITEINFYPGGKFATEDLDDACSSCMTIPFGDAKRVKEGWWKNEEYYEPVQFRAQYAQYGVENMTSQQWWKEHDLECLRYLNIYQDIIAKQLGVDIVKERIWEKGEWRVRFEGTGGGAKWINY